MTMLSIDYETVSEAQLVGPKSVGLINYMRHESTRPLMLAWSWNKGPVEQVDLASGDRIPPEVIDGLLDPHVQKWAYNAAFERWATKELLGLDTPIQGWFCTMALAYMRSFAGGLDMVGVQIGLPPSQVKDPEGSRLIRLFSMPQRITKNQPLLWRDHRTDPDDWERYLSYNRQDVITENRVHDRLISFPILDDEWLLYQIDQEINDEGLPVDMQFVRSAKEMVARRKGELTAMMQEVTSLANPNSGKQLLPWLIERGYPFKDLQKNTLKKVLTENAAGENPGFLDGSAVAVLKLRQQASRSSVKKYDTIERRVVDNERLMHCFQFAGASRTNRWSGRSVQPQNLVRTPKLLEEVDKLGAVTDAIREGNYDLLDILVDEPMVALAGCMRSSFRAPAGYEFVVCDLSAIESAVIAWLSGCKRMLGVFANKLDPYKDFGTELYGKPYAAITKEERNICKPPTLGCGFGLGGGKLREGKRTGLWGYAESMGVDITRDEAHRQVKLFRRVYPEIPQFWQDLERAARRALRGETVTVNGLLTFQRRSNFLTVRLPSGRLMFYHKPRMMKKEFPDNKGGTYERVVFTHMGKSQVGGKWVRLISGGPKLCLGADSRVLTSSGWKRIVEVTSDDLVWDGEAWVTHGGVVFNGYADTLMVDGVEMTPNHLVLTERGWDEAQNCGGAARAATAIPELYAQGKSSWNEPSSGVFRVAEYEVPMSVAHASCVEELRSAWDNDLRTLDGFRKVLGGYGSDLSTRTVDRTAKQRQRVFTGELPVGNLGSTSQQSTQHCSSGYSLGEIDSIASGSPFGHREDHIALPIETRLRPVFDILNAGRNNRFVVAGEIGPFRVHNCENFVQSAARDTLGSGVIEAREYGFKIVGTVHDEIITLRRKGDNYFTLEALRDCMLKPRPWMQGLPLGAAGYVSELYRKE